MLGPPSCVSAVGREPGNWAPVVLREALGLLSGALWGLGGVGLWGDGQRPEGSNPDEFQMRFMST